MEGCLSTLIKLLILGALFVVGHVLGHMYLQGAFDSYLLDHSFKSVIGITVGDATKRVDIQATPDVAHRSQEMVEGKVVLWQGQFFEVRTIGTRYTALSLLTHVEPRQIEIVFYNQPLADSGIRIGDTIEVLGVARKLLVVSEDREGHPYPQILALQVKKIASGPGSSSQAIQDYTGRVTKERKTSGP
jgi:hypothetical protein